MTCSNALPECSVVLPVLDEAGTLLELHQRLTTAMAQSARSYEILYVNDGSRDATAQILDELALRDPRVIVIHLARNFGQHAALFAGFAQVRGEVVVTLDADLQNPPEEIPKLLARLGSDADVVAGVRTNRRDPWVRRLASRIVNGMVGRMTGVRLRDYGCLLRVYRRAVIDRLCACEESSVYFTALIAWLGARIVEVDVAHSPRKGGRSKYGWWKLLRVNLDLITGYSGLPVQLLSVGGALGACTMSLLSAVAWFTWWVSGDSGWTVFWVAGLLALFFAQVAAIGCVGEYVARALLQVKRRPRFVLRSELSGPSVPTSRSGPCAKS
ncbi:MAG: glycosyltransferase family 2 protein [Planctomycetota bacterium]